MATEASATMLAAKKEPMQIVCVFLLSPRLGGGSALRMRISTLLLLRNVDASALCVCSV